ncbi:acyl-CoA dehydrogenase family protein [Deltaproteobacteria bacterium IMCC39524]|nr:acyl-CoA dehydrogenase family protein [Deltaproteobacteria bacterium IMCC39524]
MDLQLTDEQKILTDTVVNFCRQELTYSIDCYEKSGEFPWEAWKKCAEMNFMAVPIPEKYGGCGVDLLTTTLFLKAFGYACKDAGLVHAIATQLLCGLQIHLFGSDELKTRYLPALCRGEKVFAQAITEPDTGSDALSMRTRAVRERGNYLLNGSKTFITNGPLANVAIVFAVTDPERKSLGRVSCFIVDEGLEGFVKGKPLEKMGLTTLQNGELFFDNCMVPSANILGKEGQGGIIFNESMEWERSLLPAAHLGTMERILETSVKYAKERKAFGNTIGSYQSISNKLSRMKVNVELGKRILWSCSVLKDKEKRATLESSICKLFISESLKQASLDAVQIHGGYGYIKEYEVERDLRDSIASTIYSGTSEIQQNIISKFLGL